MYAIVDTESNSLFDFTKPADAEGQPRMAELVMIFCDDKLVVTNEYHTYIKPDGWVMEAGATAINHITTEMLLEKGIPIAEALAVYTSAILDDNRIIVAHNAQFDCKILRGELRRAGMPDLFEQTRNICTMRGLTEVCRIPPKGNRGGYKFPKLSEACVFFDFPLLGDHSALGDARAAMQLLRKMLELGVCPEPAVHYAKNPPVKDVSPAKESA